jgi:phosphoserine phosphatase
MPAALLRPDPGEAAIFRLEGTLTVRPTLTAAAWMGLNAQRVRQRLFGLSALALAAPLSLGPLRDPARAHRVAWTPLEGMSLDRLEVLGAIYAEEHLVPTLEPVALELLEGCRRRGQHPVLLTNTLEAIARPVARHLGIETVVANHMEVVDGRATGRLREPALGPEPGGARLAERLLEHGLDLASASAYGSRASDALLLGGVARPCAVRPDRELRRLARDHDWPVVEEAS